MVLRAWLCGIKIDRPRYEKFTYILLTIYITLGLGVALES